MKKILISLGFAFAFSATPASAAIFLCDGANCTDVDTNVFIEQTAGQATVLGTVGMNSGIGITFFGGPDLLNGQANGQAAITALDGVLNGLTFTLQQGHTFGSATFNLLPIKGKSNSKADEVWIQYETAGLGQQLLTINTNGQNFTGIYGTAGERFQALGFVSNPITDGIGSFQQLRLGDVRGPAVAAVPEPGTWAMLLIGFGGIGSALRRRKRNTQEQRFRAAYS